MPQSMLALNVYDRISVKLLHFLRLTRTLGRRWQELTGVHGVHAGPACVGESDLKKTPDA